MNADTQLAKGNFIRGVWTAGSGSALKSVSPETGKILWQGNQASANDVDQAFEAARDAFPAWSQLDLDDRIAVIRRFQQLVKTEAEKFAGLIAAEMGKPLWEARTEAAAVAGKVDLAIDALLSRRNTTSHKQGEINAVIRYKPHGVLGVLGPFNLPAHLPNGHIVPAILAGNTVVFKPSELTPWIDEFMIDFWRQADLPPGVINLVQGKRDTGKQIVEHPELDGLLFTGSSRAGIAINQALAAQPQKIVALEMGGNNPLIVDTCNDPRAAAYQTVLSAFITAGQRCTCARRLILVDNEPSQRFLKELTDRITRIRVGYHADQPQPFLGTVISQQAGSQVRERYEQLVALGGKPLVPLASIRGNPALLAPALIDMTASSAAEDEEIFGPVLQVFLVDSFDDAIQKANDTKYGLSAGLLSDDPERYRTFIQQIRAGVVNWNRQTTGASGRLPFGGCGLSGNHRPSGYFAADYCSFPVASLESEHLIMPEEMLPGLDGEA